MKLKIWLFLSYLIFGINAKIFTKFIDVKENQLKPGGEEVRFKDSILRSYTPEIDQNSNRFYDSILSKVEISSVWGRAEQTNQN